MSQSTVRLEELPYRQFSVLAPETRLGQALQQFEIDGKASAVILQEQHVVGLFRSWECLQARQLRTPLDTPIGALMFTHFLALHQHTQVDEASRQLLEKACNEVIVIDDNGYPHGMLGAEELLAPFSASPHTATSLARPSSAQPEPNTAPSTACLAPSANTNGGTSANSTDQVFRPLEKQIELLSRFASALINLPADRTDAAINHALQEMGQMAQVDRSYVFRYDFINGTVSNTHEWCAEGISPQIHNMQDVDLQGFPDVVETHQRNESIVVNDVATMPPCPLREILEDQDIKSMVALPIISESECIGFLGLDAVRRKRIFRPDDLDVLTLFAKTLANYHQRAETEQKLANSESNFQAFFDRVRALLFVLAFDGEIIHCNSHATERLGFSSEEIQGRSILELHPVELRNDIRNTLVSLVNGSLDQHTLPFQARSGLLVPVEASSVVGQWNGKPALFMACRDLTEVKTSEIKFSKVFHLSAMPMILADLEDGKFLEVNQAFHQITGYRPAETVGKRVTSVGVLQAPEQWETLVEQLKQRGQLENLEIPLRSREGQTLHGLLNAAVLELNGQQCILAQILDITSRKVAEDALDLERSQLRTLLNSLPQLVWLKDPEGVYLACNAPFEEFFGHPESDILGKTDYDFVNKELADFFRENDRLASELGQSRINEETLTFASNGYCGLFETIKTPIYTASKKIIGVLGVARDITQARQQESERQRLERQMHQSSKMGALGQLTAGVAHEFNNRLAIILGHKELLDVKLGSNIDQSVQSSLEKIDDAAIRAKELIEQLIRFSRPGEKRAQRSNMATEVRKAMALSEGILPSSIEIDYQPDIELPDVQLDRSELQQMLTNLLLNARDAMNGQGRIEITLNHTAINGEECQACYNRIEGYWVELSVADTGPGIHDDERQRIFEPFYTTKDVGKGTGLGLSMVQSTMEHSGGHILLDSQPGKGSRFRLLFPALQQENTVPSMPAPQPVSIPNAESVRVLVVDDEPGLTDYLSVALSMQGLQVTIQNDSREALSVLTGTEQQFDVLITDQTMPGVLGTELAMQAKRRLHDLRVILCTGHSDQINDDNASENGVDRVLMKPVALPLMLNTIGELLT